MGAYAGCPFIRKNTGTDKLKTVRIYNQVQLRSTETICIYRVRQNKTPQI